MDPQPGVAQVRRKVAHILHGFRVTDGGAGSIDRLCPHLGDAGWKTCEHDYGYFHLIKVRWCNGSVADAVKACVRRGDIGVGHSNGCAILAEAADRGAPFAGLVFINPALDEDRVISKHVPWVHVYYNEGDRAVWAAQVLQFSHPWGAMGRVGFKGDDARYLNIDCHPDVQGHSDIFTKLEKWGPAITKRVAVALRVTR